MLLLNVIVIPVVVLLFVSLVLVLFVELLFSHFTTESRMFCFSVSVVNLSAK